MRKFVALWLSLVGLLLWSAIGSVATQDLTIGNYTLISSQRLDRFTFEYVYRAQLSNPGPAVNAVTAVLTGTPTGVTVIEGELSFGDVPAGGTVTSSDTFKVRHDRRFAFPATALIWTINATPANRAPVAEAGLDQTVLVGDPVTLDGSGSTDLDGDTLHFQWDWFSKPADSVAELLNPTTINPSFQVDQPGEYLARLVVNDGQVDSAADTVWIVTGNSRPVANAGTPQTVTVGSTVVLDGSGSRDVDRDTLTFHWSFIELPANSQAMLNVADPVKPSFYVDRAGTYQVQLIVNDGQLDSLPATVVISTQNSQPVANAGDDLTAFVGDTVTLNGRNSTDADGDTLHYAWSLTTVPDGSNVSLINADTVTPFFVPDKDGIYVAQLIVRDAALASEPDTAKVTVSVVLPPLDSDNDGLSDAEEIALGTDPHKPDTDDDGLQDGDEVKVYFTNPLNPDSDGDTFNDGEEVAAHKDPKNARDTPAGTIPPDPASVATAVDATVATTIADATRFLYAGSSAIQTGVAENTIEAKRAAIIRGRVLDKQNRPLPGVTVTIKDHPEFGQTLTRADGLFDLVVNGGGLLTLNYLRSGYLPAQRHVDVPWQDYAFANDTILIQEDSRVTTVDLQNTAQEFQIAQGNPVTDPDGTRQATLLIPRGTRAQVYNPDGSTRGVSSLNLRLTEYTVGENGPESMPAPLPPASAYTYAVELKAAEGAIKRNGKDVLFDRAVPFYVDNFLNFPAGTSVPTGYYDRDRAVWIPSASGKVIRILAVNNGLADLDSDGDNRADDAAKLAGLGITDAERAQLGGLYPAGKSLWRVRVDHLSTWDLNWSYEPENTEPPAENPERFVQHDDCCRESGSIIEAQNQILGEAVGVVGTPFALHYQSERVVGRRAAYRLEIPLSGTPLPAELQRIELEIHIAGRRITEVFPAEPDQRTTFTWDGRDAYGRRLQGPQPVTVRIGYVYKAVYADSPRFGEPGPSVVLTASPAREEFTFWRVWTDQIGTWEVAGAGLGGWTLSPHHAYVPGAQELHRGDGGRETTRSIGPTIATVAGTGVTGQSGDGGPATAARIHTPSQLAFGADGSLYIASTGAHLIRKVDPNGIISTIVSNGSGNFCDFPGCGDGGPATQARLVAPRGVAVGPDGSLYIAEVLAHRIRKVDPDGIISTIAGTGDAGFSGDGGPAHQARLNGPQTLAVGPDGAVYIADSGNARIRRIGPDGIITTFAGGGASLGDGGPATLAQLRTPLGIAVGRDGSIYLTETGSVRVRRVTPDGIIRTIAGTGVSGFAGDGFPATQAQFSSPVAVAVGPDGTVYVVDQANKRIRWFRPGGIIDTLAGTGAEATTGDGGPARQAALQNLEIGGIAVGPDGGVYLAQAFGNVRIRRIAPLVERFVAGQLVPATAGDEVFIFAGNGLHLRTLDALTGALRYQFAYDGANRLITITDGDGNVTTVERDAQGRATAIVGPFGQPTALTIGDNGYLAEISHPAGETWQSDYTADGLLTAFTNPRGETSRYAYDALGLLTRATDPTGATKTLVRDGTHQAHTVTLTSALGRSTVYRVEVADNHDLSLSTTDSAGRQARAAIGQDGRQTVIQPDGTRTDVVLGPDPRWGMRAPVAASVTLTTPDGKVHTHSTGQK